MTVSNQNPVADYLLEVGDSFSFDLDSGGTPPTEVIITIEGAATEVAYTLTGGAQPGYSVSSVLNGDVYTFTVGRTAGWDASPFTANVSWTIGGVVSTDSWSYELRVEQKYPSLMQPRNPVSQGDLIVTEAGQAVATDVGWIDFVGGDVVDLGGGKVRVLSGGGGLAGLAGIGKWTIANVAGSGTPGAGEIIIDTDDNTGITDIRISTTTAEGQNYDDWLQRFESTNEGLTVTVRSLGGDAWFSSPVSTTTLGTVGYRLFGMDDPDKANSGAYTWAVGDEVFVEILPAVPDVSGADEPSTFGIGGFTYDDTTTDTSFPSGAVFRLDNVRPSNATRLWIYFSSRQGYDLSSIFDAAQGSRLTFHARDGANGNFQCTLGQPVDKGNYYEFPLSDVTDNGVDLADGERFGVTVIPSGDSASSSFNGFVNMDDVSISLDYATRTLTMAGDFEVYSGGVPHSLSSPSYQWPDTYINLYFVIDETGTLTAVTAVSEEVLTNQCLVGVLFWHQVDDDAPGGFFNMMKHVDTNPRWWYQTLTAEGLQHYRGLALTLDAAADQDGSSDAHIQAQSFVGAGLLGGTDHTIAARLAVDPIDKVTRLGSDSGGFWDVLDADTSFLVATAGTGRAAYTQLSGSNYSTLEVSEGFYTWSHYCAATGDNPDEGKCLVFMGRGEYATKEEAEAAVVREVQSIRVQPTNQEAGIASCFVPVYSVLIQTSDTYTNSAKSRVVSTVNGDDYIDHTRTYIPVNSQSPGGSPATAIPPQLPGEPNGFEDRTDCVLTWDNPTRTLTLTGTYNVWSDGTKFTRTNDSFQIADTEGDHFIYYDAAGDLQELLAFDISLISEFAFVAYVYWDATNSEAVPGAMNEQHGASMTSSTHEYLHFTQGTQYESGLALTMSAVDDTGDDNTHAQFSGAAGVIWDEDIEHTIAARAVGDNIPVLYKDGASGNWRMDDSASFPVITTGTGRAAWNEFTGGAWQLTEVGSNDFVLAHIYAVPGVNEDNGYLVAIVGQAEYATLGQARDGAEAEIVDLNTAGLPFPEFKEVGTIILQTSDGYANDVKSKVRSTDSGDDYVDWRLSDFSSAGVSSTSVAWGNVSGTLSNQTDLQAALDAKSPAYLGVRSIGKTTLGVTGAGEFDTDNATPALVTTIRINVLNDLLGFWDNPTQAGTLKFTKIDDPTNFVIYDVTAIDDVPTYGKDFTVAHRADSVGFAFSGDYSITWLPDADAGGGGDTRTIWQFVGTFDCKSIAGSAPSTGQIAFDSATPSSVTEILLDDFVFVENPGGGGSRSDLKSFLNGLEAGDFIQCYANGSNFVEATVVSSAPDGGDTFSRVTVSAASGSGTLSTADNYVVYVAADSASSGSGGGGGGSGTVTLATNQTVVVDQTEVVVGGGVLAGNAGKFRILGTYVDGSATTQNGFEVRFYDVGPVAGPPTAGDLVATAEITALDTLDTVEVAVTTTAGTPNGTSEIRDSERAYEVRLYLDSNDNVDAGNILTAEFVES